ncbi:MAG: hypothetical protein HYX48_06020 [Chlamydiales bacterium]|nr:hypothetical protein [Chlamydiales bacterium]
MTSRAVDHALRSDQDAYVALCEMADADSFLALSRISKAFRDATREVTRFLISKLDQTLEADSVDRRYSDLFNEDLPSTHIPALAQGCSDLVRSAFGPNLNARSAMRTRAQPLFAIFNEMQSSNLTNKRFALFYSDLMPKLRACQLPEARQWALQQDWITAKLAAEGETDTFAALTPEEQAARRGAISLQRDQILFAQEVFLDRALTFAQKFCVRELVAQRFEAVMRRGTPGLHPFMRDLRSAATETQSGFQRFQAFRRDPQRLSLPGITQLEEFLITDTAHNRDKEQNFVRLCEALNYRGQNLDVTQPDATLRATFRGAAEAIGQLKHLILQNVTGVPREINALTSLETLEIHFSAASRASPDFEAFSFSNLTSLVIYGSRFDRTPTFAPSATALSCLVIHQKKPIRVLPDDLARRTQANGLLANAHRSNNNNIPYMNLDPHQLSDIPFFIWFRDKSNIPLIPVFEGLNHLSEIFNTLTRNFIFLDAIYLIPCLPLATLGALSFVALYALNIAIMGVNLFINYAIEPIVTLFRDQLGYSRMVHIHTFPEQGALS